MDQAYFTALLRAYAADRRIRYWVLFVDCDGRVLHRPDDITQRCDTILANGVLTGISNADMLISTLTSHGVTDYDAFIAEYTLRCA